MASANAGAKSKGGVGILGLGVAVPPTVRTNAYWEGKLAARDEGYKRKEMLELERTVSGESVALPAAIAEAQKKLEGDPFRGARERRVLRDEDDVTDLEAEASRMALEDAGVKPEELDLVMVFSPIPDTINPGNAVYTHAKIGAVNATAWNFDAACASFLAQLIVADALVKAGSYQKILLVCSSSMSRVLDYGNLNSLYFGDGAAAAVIGAVPEGYGILGHWSRTDSSLREGVCITPVVDGQHTRRWDLAPGPLRLGSMDAAQGKRAGLKAVEFCNEACGHALSRAGMSIDDVAVYVGAQSLGWFVDACRRGLGLGDDQFIDSFAETANTTGAVIPTNLRTLRETGRLGEGDGVLMYSPGTGLTRVAVAYRWHSARKEGGS